MLFREATAIIVKFNAVEGEDFSEELSLYLIFLLLERVPVNEITLTLWMRMKINVEA